MIMVTDDEILVQGSPVVSVADAVAQKSLIIGGLKSRASRVRPIAC